MPLPDSTRYAKDAAEAIGAAFEDLDAGAGYLFRISKNGRFVLGGGGNVCTYPVNSAGAYTISRDKAHTKTVLASRGVPVIPGGLFFAQDAPCGPAWAGPRGGRCSHLCRQPRLSCILQAEPRIARHVRRDRSR